jgi:2,4-dienoyl-CoA reductase-like NADH-dependent reductase (Old Yellow Enzyme family)
VPHGDPSAPGTERYDRLFSSVRVGSARLRNRAVVAPMTRISAADDGCATDLMTSYYEEFARGGWGLVETEATYIDREHSQCKARQPGLATASHLEAWRRVVDAVHAAGASIFVQLQHAGALAEVRTHRPDSVAPSAVPPRSKRPFPTPRALASDEILRICDHFAAAAARAVDAGFDGVELHGANGYLIDQFLTDYTNLRTDDYGGPASNRARFAADVVRAVRRAVPEDFPVGIRLAHGKTGDPQYAWPGGEGEAVTIFQSIVAAGATFLHIGGPGGTVTAVGGRTLIEIAKEATGATVFGNGGLQDPVRAEALLRTRAADLASIARGALANPDWPRRVAAHLPLATYDPAMILPAPTLDRAEDWRRQQPAGVSLEAAGAVDAVQAASAVRDGDRSSAGGARA